MYNFNFYNPVKVLFGPGRLNDLHEEQLPGRKALIAIGAFHIVGEDGLAARLTRAGFLVEEIGR